MHCCRVVGILVLMPAVCTVGGLITITGEDWTPSSDRRSFVVAGEVRKVILGDMGEDVPHTIEVNPLATLAGNFDPSLNEVLVLRFYTGFSGSSILKVPEEGSLVLAVVALRDPDDPDSIDMVTSAICTFMPKGSALVEIRGLDDPKYRETVEKLRKARAIAIERSRTRATTQTGP